jgi:GNAT superfamily N-acetyltransferase
MVSLTTMTAPEIEIRPLDMTDVASVVELRAAVWPDEIATPDSFAWAIGHTPPEEQVERWVATEGSGAVGWATAGLDSWTKERLGFIYGGVRPDRRRCGIGGRLFAVAEDHLSGVAPAKTRTGTMRGDIDSADFVTRRGFTRGRSEQVWSVDPRSVPLTGFEQGLATALAHGLRLVALRELVSRPESLFALTVALERDVPSDEVFERSYDNWLEQELGSPLFSPDASYCLVDADAEPVAMSWILHDAAHLRARHGLTGTIPAYRHKGLARLVKQASIAWLADHGVTALFTDNDTQNRDMLALNEHLGYRPLAVFDFWTR